MQASISALILLGIIYSTMADSNIFQSIRWSGEGGIGGRNSGNGNDWTDSAHNSDTDKLLRELSKFDDNNGNNFGNPYSNGGGFDTDKSGDDSEERRRGFQFIQFS